MGSSKHGGAPSAAGTDLRLGGLSNGALNSGALDVAELKAALYVQRAWAAWVIRMRCTQLEREEVVADSGRASRESRSFAVPRLACLSGQGNAAAQGVYFQKGLL